MATASSGSGNKPNDVAEMMKKLGFSEEDLDDVVIEEEEEIPAEAVRWLAIARVHIEKYYSQYWFYRNMRVAWDLAKDVKIRPLTGNLYTMQFACLGDWERVMKEGPWTYKGNAMILAPYDGFTKPSAYALDTLELWA